MTKIKFDIVFDVEDSTPTSGEGRQRRYPTMPNCFGCGRFCRMHTYQQYNGHFNIWYADVSCSKCGEYTEQLT
jgi:hypothetical protein